MIIAGTGHRPDKLGGYSDEINSKLIDLAEAFLELETPEKVISGVALGWDLALACAAINKNIPLIAAIPCNSQTEKWRHEDQLRHQAICDLAEEVHVLSQTYHGGVMQARNVWMVDRCDLVLALWDGSKSGGTFNCIKYANKIKKPVTNLWTTLKAM